MYRALASPRSPDRLLRACSLAFLLALLACESTPESEWTAVAPADELYAQGLVALQGQSILGVYQYVD